jgi:hypothetical protein
MPQRAWMADAERLMNLMESFDYKSERYNVVRKVLLSHLAQKPNHDEEVEAWTMTGPAPFEFELDAPPPEQAQEKEPEPLPPPKPTKAKKRSTAAKKAVTPKAKKPKDDSAGKAKSVRKKSSASTVAPAQTLDP